MTERQVGALRSWHCLLQPAKPQPAQQPQAVQVLLWSHSSASQVSTISSCAWGRGREKRASGQEEKPPNPQDCRCTALSSSAHRQSLWRFLLFQSALWPRWQSVFRAHAAFGQWFISSSAAAQATRAARQTPMFCLLVPMDCEEPCL